ncbi:GNAT family N-acetyltransferase [Pseudomonas sp. G(2018)]|uniref:GNAT family N-acetyltransferase n=1 Tax=Pseudomonas sp. G(2018) TaxID=2502242 RepID=UPI00148559D2|nr:GNAT family N-acetyltransferase [Pseudomonas sp. G(2018)]
MALEISLNKASVEQIAAHLLACDPVFVPPLSGRVDIGSYASKIAEKSTRFEGWVEGELVGLVAVYCNEKANPLAYITSVSVLSQWGGQGIASQLIKCCIDHVSKLGFVQIELEVDERNQAATHLYQKHGFKIKKKDACSATMCLTMAKEIKMETQRDYNVEIKDTADHQYAYSFDFDVMHPYMIRSFKPFFNNGSLLELGSFKGDFTRRFLEHFDDVTCVEASEVAIEEAKQKLGDKVKFIHSLFETAELPKRYDNIVLTHVLEHIDDPVRVLKRINDEWLAEGGRFFLVCPNANAPSRQIAVKMGLISHNSAVTPAELEHGHRCTYSLDTLERDAVAAGLKVVHRTGIFFKALANFQWDKLLNTDIISEEYLEGCYKLGQLYPDLCSSVFLMCERGD